MNRTSKVNKEEVFGLLNACLDLGMPMLSLSKDSLQECQFNHTSHLCKRLRGSEEEAVLFEKDWPKQC
ncbi:hypothetical protein P7K49_022004 [Saguinus oedipus]|uniref:Uncharacterized protein n=1 Tax=Saguinus oedipus TaxID=9490 RepID=A0ABQ9UV01_SAGOE|nr:hypothetical protein P7K49_022004 [Saguinus oedipus]